MSNRGALAWSSVGKKYVSGITGLLLVGFLIAHLVGNLTLLMGADVFNGYAYFLESLGHGMVIIVFEIVLIAFFAFHIASGISVARTRRAARDQAYYVVTDAGGRSRKSFSSKTMIVSGIVLLLFVVIHVRMFKYGDTAMIERYDGHEMRDLYMLVVNSFADPIIVLFYVTAMTLLGLHLRHGVWSAFQSIGANHPRYMPGICAGGIALGMLLAVGFLFLPLIIFVFNEHFVAKGGV